MIDLTSAAFDPREFEQHVQQASRPAPTPVFQAHLLNFVERHAPGTPVVIGNQDGYDWSTGVLSLTKETAQGSGMRAYLTVAHECAHAHQRRDWPWLPVWTLKVPLVRAWLELNCWHRALSMLS